MRIWPVAAIASLLAACGETCQGVIDANGGPLGDAAAAAQPLGECAAMSCPDCPQPSGG